jgi:hypothetical protein
MGCLPGSRDGCKGFCTGKIAQKASKKMEKCFCNIFLSYVEHDMSDKNRSEATSSQVEWSLRPITCLNSILDFAVFTYCKETLEQSKEQFSSI